MTNLSFIRSDLAQFNAYTPHPGGEITIPVDQLDTNESPWDLPQQLKEKLAWNYQHNIKTNRYPDGSHDDLKKAIATYVNESGNSNLNWTNISVGNGSDELIRSLLIATCLGEEGSILVANPTFSMYAILAKTLGISVVSIERDETDFSLDLTAANQALKNNSKIRVVFVVNPNSPTANALNEQEVAWLRSLPEHILVVIDEAYFEFSQTSLVAELNQHPNWIILRTFSKAFRLAALRVGYAIAHPDLIQVLEKIRLPYNLPSFSQIAALFALNHRNLILPLITETISERERLFNQLSQHKSLKVWKSSANFLYLRLQNNSLSLEQITKKLKEKGTLIRHTGGGLRITIGTVEENNRTLERLEDIVVLNYSRVFEYQNL